MNLVSIAVALLLAFAGIVILAPIYIGLLQRLGYGKQIRTDGPEAHYGKAGTPTMGGMLVVVVVLFLAMALRLEGPATLTPTSRRFGRDSRASRAAPASRATVIGPLQRPAEHPIALRSSAPRTESGPAEHPIALRSSAPRTEHGPAEHPIAPRSSAPRTVVLRPTGSPAESALPT